MFILQKNLCISNDSFNYLSKIINSEINSLNFRIDTYKRVDDNYYSNLGYCNLLTKLVICNEIKSLLTLFNYRSN